MSDLYDNYFVLPADAYKRDVDVLKHYVEDATTYLMVSTGKPKEVCLDFIKKNLRPGGDFPFVDPEVEYLQREENGDRARKTTTLRRYLAESLASQELIAPTFTTYVNPKIDKSLLAIYVEENIAKRGKAKKEMFAARAAGNKELASVKKIEQTGRKLANNSISGAHVSASTPLYNKTAHSTLTSVCRCTSGYGNANNEKLLSGNRHYFNHHIVLNNIITIINNFDEEFTRKIIAKFNIHYPTVEETMNCIIYSASQYWWDREKLQLVIDLVNKLTDIQRAAFVYSGDMFQLMSHNQELMREFITKLSNKVFGQHPNPLESIYKAPDSYVNLAHKICHLETKGIGKDYDRIKDTDKIHTLALTIENIAHTVIEYSELIKAFWMPEIVPASLSHFPDSIRRSALTSDTDSTIFTVQDWVIWYSGKISFDDRSRAVYSSVVFLASSTITHILAKMSANLGIVEEHLFKIAMKSEFSFDVFIPTQLGKHYYAAISCQEGEVFEEFDYEIKGAQLRSANAPREIIKAADVMMKKIMHDVMEKGTVSLYEHLRTVADIERQVEASIRSGKLNYLRNGSIKDSGSYAGEAEDSPYQNHFFWQEVFAEKYGEMPNPPYNTKKIPVSTDTAAKLRAWIDGIQDVKFKDRLVSYLAKNEKTTIGTFNLPVEIISAKGIPEEIIEIIDFDKLKLDICRIFYIILETLGYYAVGDKTKKLISKNGF